MCWKWLKIFDSIIMEDESWCFAYDPETKCQCESWCGENSSRVAKLYFQNWKLLILFFDSQGVVHQEFVPLGETVNAQFYLEVLHYLCKNHTCEARDVEKSKYFFPARQHTSTHGDNCATGFGQERGHSHQSLPLLPWYEFTWLFRISKTKIRIKGESLCHGWGNPVC